MRTMLRDDVLRKVEHFYATQIAVPSAIWLGQRAWDIVRREIQLAYLRLDISIPPDDAVYQECIPAGFRLFGIEVQSSETNDLHVSVHP